MALTESTLVTAAGRNYTFSDQVDEGTPYRVLWGAYLLQWGSYTLMWGAQPVEEDSLLISSGLNLARSSSFAQ